MIMATTKKAAAPPRRISMNMEESPAVVDVKDVKDVREER
jgi:hypothetical protein